MAEFVSGDVVVVPFPFTDLQASKRRPAVVLATFARGDLLICQVTSRSESHSVAVAINAANFMRGGIDRPSVALPHRLVTVHAASTAGWRRNSRPLPASRGLPSPRSNQGRAAVTVTAMPSKFQKSRRVAATMFRWMLPTRPRRLVMATDGKVGPPGRSPKGLFRLVHNCE